MGRDVGKSPSFSTSAMNNLASKIAWADVMTVPNNHTSFDL